MNDGDRALTLSPSQSDGLRGRLWSFDDIATEAERSAADLATGLVSLGFIRAALQRGAGLWCGTALLGLLVGFGYIAKSPPAHQASTSVLLGANPFESPADAAMDTQALIESRTVASEALRELGLRESPEALTGDYTVTILTNQVLVITAKATSSDLAVREANALATAFLAFQANQAETQERLVDATLQQQINVAQQHINSISKQINVLAQQQPDSRAVRARISNLSTERERESSALTALKQANNGNQASTQIAIANMVKGSQVLDVAVPLPRHLTKYLLLYAGAGLVIGLALGMFIVIVRALVSDRLRRRDDVARVIGAPVKLSVGRVRLRRRLSGPRRLEAAHSPEIQRIIGHLVDSATPYSRGMAALAVVPVDDPDVAALALAALARGVAHGLPDLRIVVADLCPGAPAAHLLDVNEPGVHEVQADFGWLMVAVPDRGDVAPVGPLGAGSSLGRRSAFTEAVSAGCESADLLLTLATVDPSLGGDYLAGWTSGAVAVVTAGRSSAERVHAVGELIRLGGTQLISAVLVGADKSDESLGVTAPTSPAPVGTGLS